MASPTHSVFDNPILTGSRLIQGYRNSIGRTLVASGISAEYLDQVLSTLQLGPGVDLESTLWLTRRRPFVRRSGHLVDEAASLGLSREVARAFASLDHLWAHQHAAIEFILGGRDTVVATGTGSGKTEAFLIPVFEMCFRQRATPGVKAIIIYPRNALVLDQLARIKETYLHSLPLTAGAFIGDVSEIEKEHLLRHPPDILLTNHVMLERILTDQRRRNLIGTGTLSAVVLDELHTFRGNAGADTAWLLKRLTARSGTRPVFVGASATLHDKPGGALHSSEGGDTPLDSVVTFARNLFSFSETERLEAPVVIEPLFVDDETNGGEFPEPDWGRLPGWSHDFDDYGAHLVESVMGATPGLARGSGRLKPAFELSGRLERHALIRTWKRLLLEPRQFSELVDACATTYQDFFGRACPDARLLTESALQVISLDRNDASRSEPAREPAMNIVIHVTTRGLEGPLLICITCGKHHVGPEALCPDPTCGQPLTLAFRDDPRRGLIAADGKNRSLRPITNAHSPITALTVTVSRLDAPHPRHEKSFRARIDPVTAMQHGYEFTPDDAGEYLIEVLDHPRGEAAPIARSTLTSQNLEHFLEITWQMLQAEVNNPRLLIFSNQRDRAAHVGYMLKADRAERHLAWQATHQQEHPVRLTGVPERLNGNTPTTIYDKELASSVTIWLARLCSTSARRYTDHRESLCFIPSPELDALPALERRILNLCLLDGVIDWTDLLGQITLPDQSIIFQYDRRWRTQHPRLTHHSVHELNERDRRVILSDNPSSTHHDLVEDVGIEAVMSAVESLAHGGWLIEGETDAGLFGYRLSIDRLAIGPRLFQLAENASKYHGTGIHSRDSDVESRKRMVLDFKQPNSGLAQISATSTLELGIDIGSLQHVACYGIPTNPASFAQRAGRAGRGRAARYALVLTWGESSSETESRLIRDSNELRHLLSGSALVPQIDPTNPAVARRHLFAETLATDWARWNLPHAKLESQLQQARMQIQEPVAEALSSLDIDCDDALRRVILPWLRAATVSAGASLRNQFYESIHAPDYGFSRGDIVIKGAAFGSEEGVDRNEDDLGRSPQIAIRSLYPGALIRLPAGIGEITEATEFGEPISLPSGRIIKRVTSFGISEDKVGKVRVDDTKDAYDIRCVVFPDEQLPQQFADYGWIDWHLKQDAQLAIANLGPANAHSLARESFPEQRQDLDDSADEGPFTWGYEVNTDVLRFRFNPELLDIESTSALLGAISLAIQRRFSLSDDDFAVLPELDEQDRNRTGRYVITDIGGRNLLPLHRIGEDFQHCILDAHRVAVTCKCPDGCFRCVRAQSTRFIFPFASKRRAIELLGALLGKTAFRPSLPTRPALHTPDTGVNSAVSLHLRGKPGSQFVYWCSQFEAGEVPLAGRKEQAALLEALLKALKHVPSGATVGLATNKTYIRNYLSGSTTGKGIDPSWRWLGLKYRWLGEAGS